MIQVGAPKTPSWFFALASLASRSTTWSGVTTASSKNKFYLVRLSAAGFGLLTSDFRLLRQKKHKHQPGNYYPAAYYHKQII